MGITREEISLNKPLVEGMLIMKDTEKAAAKQASPYEMLTVVERKDTHANCAH